MRIGSFLILLFFIFIYSTTSAQIENPCKYVIEGKVFNLETNEPLSFVAVQIENSSRGTISDDLVKKMMISKVPPL